MLRRYEGMGAYCVDVLLNSGAAVLRPYLEFTNPLQGEEILEELLAGLG